MAQLAPMLGVLAGVLSVVGTLPYVRDTLRGSTRPHRGSWLIWGVLAAIACCSQRADGASWSLVMVSTQALLIGLVSLLSIRWGEGGVGGVDLALMALAGAGIVGWVLSRQPLVATACVVAADLVAFAMTAPKAWRDPGSETLVTYATASAAGALAAAAVAAPDPALLIYPVYFCLANGATSLLIYHRRAALRGRDRGATRGWAARPAAFL
jgi:hypothetical protein